MDRSKKEIIESYISAYNNFDLDGMTENLHADVVFENISNGQVNLTTTGIAAFRQQAVSAIQYFRERRQVVDRWETDGELIRVYINYHAVLAQNLPNGRQAGDILELKGTSEFGFADGKILRLTDRS